MYGQEKRKIRLLEIGGEKGDAEAHWD